MSDEKYSPQPIDPYLLVFGPDEVAAAIGTTDRRKGLEIIRTLPHIPGRPPKISRKVFEAWASGVPAAAIREAAETPSMMLKSIIGG